MRVKGVFPLVLVAAGMALLAAPALADDSSQSQSILDPAGPQAQHISDLWYIILIPALMVLLLVGGAILYAAFRFRAREGTDLTPKQIGDLQKFADFATRPPATVTPIRRPA